MAGLRDIVALIPPILLSSWAITAPQAQSLHDARIMGSTDATYGTVGWLPPLDGSPWAVLDVGSTNEDETYEPNRVRITADIPIFLAVENADTEAVLEDFHGTYLAWQDALRQLIPQNRFLQPGSLVLSSVIGDVRWVLKDGKLQPAKLTLGSEWYGVVLRTTLSVTIGVTYQG